MPCYNFFAVLIGKIIGLGIMLLLLIPVSIVVFFAYTNLSTMYQQFKLGVFDAAFWVVEIFLLIMACITVPLAIVAIVFWYMLTAGIIMAGIDTGKNTSIKASISSFMKKYQLFTKSTDEQDTSAESLKENNSSLSDINKIEYIYADTNDLVKDIKDITMRKQLFKILDIIAHIINYLRDHPEKAPLAYRHLNYYLEKTLFFTQSYIDLDETMLDTLEVKNTKNDILEILIDFEKAYELKFTTIISYSLFELNASLAVANDILDEHNSP